MPGWVKTLLDDWLQAANLTAGKLFRRVNKNGKAWNDGLTEKPSGTSSGSTHKAGIERLAPIFAGRAPASAIPPVDNWTKYGLFSGTSPSKRPNVIWAASSAFAVLSTIASELSLKTESRA